MTCLGAYLAYIAHENAPGLETPPGRKFARNMIAAWPYINVVLKSDYFIKVLYYRGGGGGGEVHPPLSYPR